MNKKQHILAFVLGFGVPVALFGIGVNAYLHRPKPQPTITVSQHQAEVKAATDKAAAETQALTKQVQDSKVQLTTLINQKAVACAQIAKYKIKTAACD